MALAVLARDWTRERGGSVAALVVDHGLRPESADEAAVTIGRLDRPRHPGAPAAADDPGARPGAGRARPHHALSGSLRCLPRRRMPATCCLATMPATRSKRWRCGSCAAATRTALPAWQPCVKCTASGCCARCWASNPRRLRRFLAERGIAWVEDPSNRDLRALRPRLRHLLADNLAPGAIPALMDAIAAIGRMRATEEAAIAAELADRAEIRPEGFALLSHRPDQRSRLVHPAADRRRRGAIRPPSRKSPILRPNRVRPRWPACGSCRPGGVGDGWLVLREEAAIAGPRPGRARHGLGQPLPPDHPARLARRRQHRQAGRRCGAVPTA